jgi:hypothetical protein
MRLPVIFFRALFDGIYRARSPRKPELPARVVGLGYLSRFTAATKTS